MRGRSPILFFLICWLPACSDPPVGDAPVTPPSVNIETPAAPAPAQTDARPAAVGTQPPICVDLAGLDPRSSPAELYPTAAACFVGGDLQRGAAVYWLASAFGVYDSLRIDEPSIEQRLDELRTATVAALPEAEQQRIAEALEAFRSDQTRWGEFCQRTRPLGPPSYQAQYLARSADAFASIRTGFMAKESWERVVAEAMECPPDLAPLIRDGMSMAAVGKTAVSEFHQAHGQWPGSNTEAGISDIPGPPVSISIGTAGVITIRFSEPAELAGKSLELTPKASADPSGWSTVQWTCTSADLPANLRPPGCG